MKASITTIALLVFTLLGCKQSNPISHEELLKKAKELHSKMVAMTRTPIHHWRFFDRASILGEVAMQIAARLTY